VRTPIIGCGGISTAADAAEYMLAGAVAVQVGTATFVRPGAMIEIIAGLDRFCDARGFKTISELTGALKREETDEDDLAWLAPTP
jgi:dihydroorotate dehydrogenase (NAD+) catalytic subunit